MEVIKKYFPDLTEQQKKQFESLRLLYEEWNNIINVISRKDISNLYLHHILHSLAIAKYIRFPDAEASMRRLLESLTPEARQIYWKWVGGMFALYVVLILTAAGVFVGHESSRKLAQQPVTTVAVDGKQRSIGEVSAPLRQAARYD